MQVSSVPRQWPSQHFQLATWNAQSVADTTVIERLRGAYGRG